jgi:hypothetical protein
MSTIWTPSGERPIRREPEPEPEPQPDARSAGRAAARPSAEPGYEREPTPEEIAAEMAEVQRQLLQTPASVVVANHCIGLFQLAVLHLEQSPPNLADAKVAIDAMGAIVDTLAHRLGEDERSLREALSQLRMAYVQRQGAGGQPAGS